MLVLAATAAIHWLSALSHVSTVDPLSQQVLVQREVSFEDPAVGDETGPSDLLQSVGNDLFECLIIRVSVSHLS